MRLDAKGGIWYAGDYNSNIGDGSYTGKASNISIEQGVFWNMAGWDNNDNTCKDLDINSWDVDGASRSEAWKLKDYQMEDFTLRAAYVPVFEQAFAFTTTTTTAAATPTTNAADQVSSTPMCAKAVSGLSI